VHPGVVLMEELLEPLGVTQHRLAVEIGMPPRRINEIVHGKRRITADTALRLARCFGTTDRLWLNLQTATTGDREGPPRHGTRGDPPTEVRLTPPDEQAGSRRDKRRMEAGPERSPVWSA
jgi:addiction module HigA family antidote